jgi:hypothetical protein
MWLVTVSYTHTKLGLTVSNTERGIKVENWNDFNEWLGKMGKLWIRQARSDTSKNERYDIATLVKFRLGCPMFW